MLLQNIEASSPDNKYPVWKGSTDPTLSAFVQLAEDQPNRDQIWRKVELNLIRLSGSATQDFRAISPQRVMQAFFQLESSGIDAAAKAFGKRYAEIRRYESVVGTSLALVLQREGLVTHSPSFIDQPKYMQLVKLNHEADVIKRVMDQPPVAKQLETMPDLEALLQSFQSYSTVRLFLDENMVPYSSGQMGRFNASVREYLFGQGDPRMGPLLRKSTLSLWVRGYTNWFREEEGSIERGINHGAAFVCSEEPPAEVKTKVYYMRRFLSEIIGQELARAQENPLTGTPFAIEDIFMPINGNSIHRLGDIDIAETYSLMAECVYQPRSLGDVLNKFLEDPDSLQRYRRLVSARFNQAYSDEFRRHWVGAGFVFLENALLLSAKESPSWDKLTVNRAKLLDQFRRTFQQEYGKEFAHSMV